MAQSTPHIYVSALPFAPSSSIIGKLYSARFPRIVDVERGRLRQWPALVMAIFVPNKVAVICVAWSRNDEYVAAGLYDGDVCVWNASTGTRISEPFAAGREPSHIWDHAFVSSIAFSHDGRCLASGLSDGRIRIWELTTRTEVVVLGKKPGWGLEDILAISALSFSQDGKLLVSGSQDCKIWIWDLDNGNVLAGPFCGHKNPVWAVTFLPDQEHILSRSGFRTVRVWNVKTGHNVVKPFEFENVEIPTGTIDSAVYHDGNDWGLDKDRSRTKSGFASCLWTEAMECEEQVYMPEKRYIQRKPAPPYWIQAAAFSYDGRFVATSNSECTHIWYANGRSAGELAGGPFNNDQGTCLAFSADGQQILSGSFDGIMRVWNVGIVDDDLDATACAPAPYPVGFTPNGKQIVLHRSGVVQVMDVSTGREVVKFEEWCWGTAASLHGDFIALITGSVLWIKTQTDEVVAHSNAGLKNHDWISTVTFSPDVNHLVAFGTHKGAVWVVNAATGVPIAKPKQIYNSDTATFLKLSPSTTNSAMSTSVAVVSFDKVFIWHLHSGHLAGPFKSHRGSFAALEFSADARHIISVCNHLTLCVWDSTTGDIKSGPVWLSEQKAYAKESITLSQYGQRVAFPGTHGTILIFEVVYNGDSGISLHGPLILGGHADSRLLDRGMVFSGDGRLLATTLVDHTVRVWDLVRAAADHKQILINSASDNSAVTNFNEVSIDDDGWAMCPTSRGGSPLRLMWIPEMYRKSIYWDHPCCARVVGHLQKETLLDLKKFVHGKDWVKCMA